MDYVDIVGAIKAFDFVEYLALKIENIDSSALLWFGMRFFLVRC